MAKKPALVQRDLQKDLGAAKVLKEHLLAIMPEDGLDPGTLRDMVEGETSLLETIEKVAFQIAQDKAAVEGIAKYESTLSARKSRLNKRVETLRAMLLNVLDLLEEDRFDLSIATLTKKRTPVQLLITAEPDVPSKYWVTPPATVSRKLLGDDLKSRAAALEALHEQHPAGIPVEVMEAFRLAHPLIPGAELDNGGVTLQVNFA